ncbi:MAG TPA: DoxX family protein [Candidatus Nanoarchaeia archaeon]|nr:DoxX family protein [Candidatus Nanoarchaeia archaeon]
MKPKTTKILYWSITILFCLANFLSGIAEFFPNPQTLEVMTALGYPAYLLIILGIAKILGSVAIIQTKFKVVKEWAYAGFTIDYIAASVSFYFIKGGAMAILFSMVFLAVMFGSYYLWKKVERMKV